MSNNWIKLPVTDSGLLEDNRETAKGMFSGSARLYVVAVVLIAVAALLFRLNKLSDLPMHHDEANQAVRCGLLQKTGTYKYDPSDHHGPSLYYITLPFTWISSGKNFAGTSEATFRIVPVLFGVGLILLLLSLTDGMGRGAVIISALLTAISPGMVYYSRFYIQETLLVFFSLAVICAVWRYLRSGKTYLAVLAGVSFGMMYATKETCVIGWAGMAAGILAALSASRGSAGGIKAPSAGHLGIASVAAVSVIIVLFSSFFTNIAGPMDSIKAYAGYFGKGLSDSTGHVHPWNYYIKIIGYTVSEGGLVWTEGIINILALAGFLGAFLPLDGKVEHKGFARFIAVYTLVMVIVYSLVPYKTPWCALSFLHGMILLAGIGGVFLLRISGNWLLKGIVVVLVFSGLVHLYSLSTRVNGRFACDYRNPYAYVQTTRDFMKLVARINDLSVIHSDGLNMFIQVITPPDKTWPLPWYLRAYTKVGYWNSPEEVKGMPDPAVLITVPDFAEFITPGIANSYISEYYSVRAEVLLSVYIRKDLWDAFMKTRN